jgi:hypothetical protein
MSLNAKSIKGFMAMPTQQKELDTVAAGTYTGVVSSHKKLGRCVK